MTETPSPQSNDPADDWHSASHGEVVQLTRGLRGRRTRRQFLRLSGIGVGLLAVSGGWWMFRTSRRADAERLGGLTCAEVAAHADDWKQNRLSPDLAAQMLAHVTQCPRCQPMFESMNI